MKTMKKFYCYVASLLVAAGAMVGCTEDITTDNNLSNEGLNNVEFIEVTADLENEMSRTTFTDGGNGGVAVWSEGDSIGAIAEDGTITECVVTSIDGGSATFSVPANTKYAVYPYASGDVYTTAGLLGHSLVSNISLDGSNKVFGNKENVMVAHLVSNNLSFKHLCGYIEVKLKGTGTVKHVALRDNARTWDALSGWGHINFSDPNNPTFTSSTGEAVACNWIYATCSNVELSKSEAKSFYFVVPPRTYKNLNICVQTDKGSYSVTAKSAIEVNRAMIRPISAIDLDALKPATATNLATAGVANCYIVPQGSDAKYYSFPARKINDAANLANVAYAHIVWSEGEQLINNVNYDAESGLVSFKYAGGNAEGNALVAVLDANHEVVWSWHIWCTDQPGYVKVALPNTTHAILDRNLGATYTPKTVAEATSISTDNATAAMGLYYQYGRPTPFPKASSITNTSGESTFCGTTSNVAILYGFKTKEGQKFMSSFDKTKDHAAMMKAPTLFNIVYFTSNNGATVSDSSTNFFAFCNNPYNTNGNLNSWPSPNNTNNVTSKGTADPCPAGYCIEGFKGGMYEITPSNNLAVTQVKRMDGEGNDSGYCYGGYYQCPTTKEVVWFPATGYRTPTGRYSVVGGNTNLWGTNNHNLKVYGIRWAINFSVATPKLTWTAVNYIGWGMNIRCRKMDRTSLQQ